MRGRAHQLLGEIYMARLEDDREENLEQVGPKMMMMRSFLEEIGVGDWISNLEQIRNDRMT